MAGTYSGFPRAQFEEGVRFAMQMGIHPDEAERPKFHFRAVKAWPPDTRLSQDGTPLDSSVRPTTTLRPPEMVLCAYEFDKSGMDELPVGARRPTRLTLTLLEAEYQIVKDAIEVEIGGDRYKMGYEIPPLGLFDAGVRQFACFAKDES